MPKKMIELYDTFPITVKKFEPSQRENIMKDSKEEIKKGYSLICEVNATHAGTIINNRIYPPDKMKRGIRSWTAPYKKPVLTNHDDTKDPIGRVISGKYLMTPKGLTDGDNWKPILHESEGYGYQRLTVKITDPEAIRKILDGRYETVSVRMSTDSCKCSICGCDWSGSDGPCEHTPGTKYEGKLAYMTTGDLSYRELSFVNIPADEYAGVKEAIIADERDAAEISLYANNDKEKVLSDMSSGENLYTLLDAEAEESDNVVSYLLDKSSKAMTINKEEDVDLSKLTKEQLMDLDLVKSLIQENIDNLTATQKTDLKELEDKVSTISLELEDAKKKMKKEDEEEEEEEKEGEDKEGKDCSCGMDEGKHTKGCPMYKDEEDEEYEVVDGKKVKKAKKGAPVPEELPENKGKGKKGGVKHGAGNLSPVQEDPADPHGGDSAELNTKVQELEDTNKKVLDENVKINAELHRMVAERLFDLKKILRKPDVVGVASKEARDKKVEEFAQRSIDSLQDQIKDLLVEQDNALITGLMGDTAKSPAISPVDMTNEIMEDKKKIKGTKHDTLTRLFPKSV